MSQSESITKKPIHKLMRNNKKFASLDAMKTLFDPHSIGIVGASGSTSTAYSMTTTPLTYLLKNNYQGKIFPINPRYQEVMGLKCYPSLSAVPEEVEVVLVLTPAKTVLEVLEGCGKKGVKGVIVISAGFAETGEEGQIRKLKMKLLADRFGFFF